MIFKGFCKWLKKKGLSARVTNGAEVGSDKVEKVTTRDAAEPAVIRFGVFELDLESGEIRRSGRRVRLAPQPFKVLEHLARNAGRLVERDDLCRHLWGDTVVDYDSGLNSCVKQIRAVLDDPSTSPRFIETLPRRGYRFIAPVRTVAGGDSHAAVAGPEDGALASGAPSSAAPWRWTAAILAVAAVAATAALLARRPPAGMAADGAAPAGVSPAAYEADLKGRYLLRQTVADDVRRAIGFFEEAIAEDPAYAPAHAGLAETWLRLVQMGAVAAAEGYPRVRSTAERAVELDSAWADAHLLLAQVAWLWDWDPDAAASAFARALELRPSDAQFHQTHAFFLTSLGRHDEAVAQIERARAIDPLSAAVNADVAWIYFFARRYEEALAASRRTLELDPDSLAAHYCRQAAASRLGPGEESYEAALAMMAAVGAPAERLDELRRLGAERGGALVREWWIDAASAGTATVPFYSRALIRLDRGELDRAFELLDESFERRELWLAMVGVDPRFDGVRGDLRYRQLLRRMNR